MSESLKATNYGTSKPGLDAKAGAEKALADAQTTLDKYKEEAAKAPKG